MSRADKTVAVAELVAEFRDSSAAVLTEYRGLTVAQLAQLRETLGATTTYSVVKNTLTKIAAREAGVGAFEDLLVGPSAIAFVKGDPVVAAKSLRDFARTHPLLVIKGGVLDGSPLDPSELARLADLESREVLLAKLAGAMKAKTSQAAALFQAPLAQVARMVDALRAKVEEGAPAAAEPTAEDVETAPEDAEPSAEADVPAGADDAAAEAPVAHATDDSATDSATDAAPSDAAPFDAAPADAAPADATETAATDAPATEAGATETAAADSTESAATEV